MLSVCCRNRREPCSNSGESSFNGTSQGINAWNDSNRLCPRLSSAVFFHIWRQSVSFALCFALLKKKSCVCFCRLLSCVMLSWSEMLFLLSADQLLNVCEVFGFIVYAVWVCFCLLLSHWSSLWSSAARLGRSRSAHLHCCHLLAAQRRMDGVILFRRCLSCCSFDSG